MRERDEETLLSYRETTAGETEREGEDEREGERERVRRERERG